MSLKDFRILEPLGKGSFASVYKVMRKSDGKIYALKRIKISKMSKKEISDALNEIRFLASIRQKNIVGFLEAFLENKDSELCIIMEFCGCGDLAQKVERYKRRRQYIDEDVIWRYLVQCLKAVQCLHEHNICHRDIKAANTFISEDGAIKIGDMNVSKRLNDGNLMTQIGTPYYMSPEIWNNRPYSFTCDIWSLGCMIYELAALKPPFLGDSFPALKRAVVSGRYLPIPRKYSSNLHKVIAAMLRVNAASRPSAAALLSSEEVSAKLYLDDLSVEVARSDHGSQRRKLMETIKVPHNLKSLGLPKACYPDVRPNSPGAWTAVDQIQHSRRNSFASIAEESSVSFAGDENSVAESTRSARSTSTEASTNGSKSQSSKNGSRRDRNGKTKVPLKPISSNVEQSNISSKIEKAKAVIDAYNPPVPPSDKVDEPYRPRPPISSAYDAPVPPLLQRPLYQRPKHNLW